MQAREHTYRRVRIDLRAMYHGTRISTGFDAPTVREEAADKGVDVVAEADRMAEAEGVAEVEARRVFGGDS